MPFLFLLILVFASLLRFPFCKVNCSPTLVFLAQQSLKTGDYRIVVRSGFSIQDAKRYGSRRQRCVEEGVGRNGHPFVPVALVGGTHLLMYQLRSEFLFQLTPVVSNKMDQMVGLTTYLVVLDCWSSQGSNLVRSTCLTFKSSNVCHDDLSIVIGGSHVL